MKILVIPHGYFGDTLFSTIIGKRLQASNNKIDYLSNWPQLEPLLSKYPYINIIPSHLAGPTPTYDENIEKNYDQVYKLSALHFIETPPEEFQTQCGLIDNKITQYDVFTNSEVDFKIQKHLDQIRLETGKKIVCYLSNWEDKTFGFTKDEYWRGINTHPTGYGGRRRNIQPIIKNLAERYALIEVGMPSNTNQYNTVSISPNSSKSINVEASVLKYADYFVGSEGGIYNIAAGVKCKTIITGDFIAQLYGPNGYFKKIPNPKLGAHLYFSENKHSLLDPLLSDNEVNEQIQYLIDNDQTSIYDWSNL